MGLPTGGLAAQSPVTLWQQVTAVLATLFHLYSFQSSAKQLWHEVDPFRSVKEFNIMCFHNHWNAKCYWLFLLHLPCPCGFLQLQTVVWGIQHCLFPTLEMLVAPSTHNVSVSNQMYKKFTSTFQSTRGSRCFCKIYPSLEDVHMVDIQLFALPPILYFL